MIKICFDRTLVVADVFADFAPHRLRKKIEVKQNELRKIKKKIYKHAKRLRFSYFSFKLKVRGKSFPEANKNYARMSFRVPCHVAVQRTL